jgi:predicted PurR-regulated permease PerM
MGRANDAHSRRSRWRTEEPEGFVIPLNSRRLLLDILLVLLLAGCLLVLRPFIVPIVWAVILAYVTWPLHRRIQSTLGQFNTAAAVLSTLLVICAVVVPVLWLGVLVQAEALDGYRNLVAYFAAGPHRLPPAIGNLPWVGARAQQGLDQLTANPGSFERALADWMQSQMGSAPGMLLEVGRTLGQAAATVFTLFFCYRDGADGMRQARVVIWRHFNHRFDSYIRVAANMTRSMLYGSVVSAAAQGLIAGLGFWIVGVRAPVLLGVLTALLSAIPVVGTAAVWVPISAWLLLTGNIWQGVVLLVWGTVLVHPTDNILRPLLISSVAHVPFLLVMFGALGGLSSFGLVGVFIGPALLTVGLAIWREWASA